MKKRLVSDVRVLTNQIKKKITIKNIINNMALSCKLTRNILKSTNCGYSLPEVTEIYLVAYEDVTAAVPTSDTGGCESISAITLASGAKFVKVLPAKNSASFEDALVVEDQGAKYRTHTLTFSLSNRYDSCLHIDFDNLSLGRYVAVIKNAEGNFLMLGRTAGLEAETATLSGGGDSNGIQIVMSANIAESVIPVVGGAIETVEDNPE